MGLEACEVVVAIVYYLRGTCLFIYLSLLGKKEEKNKVEMVTFLLLLVSYPV